MNYSSNGNQTGLLSTLENLPARSINRIQQYIDQRTENVCKDLTDLQRTVVIANQALGATYNIGMTAAQAAQMLPEETEHFRNIVRAANRNIVSIVCGDYRGD